MIQAKIKCYNCDNEFYVYQNGTKTHEQIICPHCLVEMEDQMSDMVYALMGQSDDLNRDFRKYVSERQEPFFQVNVETVEDPVSFKCLEATRYNLK